MTYEYCTSYILYIYGHIDVFNVPGKTVSYFPAAVVKKLLSLVLLFTCLIRVTVGNMYAENY